MISISLTKIKVAHYQVWSEMSPETYSQLVTDINRNGIIFPLIVDDSFTLLDGHHRYKAAKECGLEAVPVIVKSDLTEDEKLEIAYKLNSTAREISRAEKQSKARALHAEGRSYRQIAAWLGVGKSTVQRWINPPKKPESVPRGTANRDEGLHRRDTDGVEKFAELERQVTELKAQARRLEQENERLRGANDRKDREISSLKASLATEKLMRSFSNGSDNGLKVFAHMVGLSQAASPAEIRREFRKAQARADSDSLKINDSSRTWVAQRYNSAAEVFTEMYG